MKRPNVLIMYTDQQRWDTIAAAGYPHMKTPNLDRLAEKGILFENAFCNNPVCMPSRQSMLSGQYPSSVGCTWNGVEMDESTPTLATILGGCGYHTANIGKLHFKNHSNRDHREPHPSYGFDTMILSDEPGCYDDAYIKWVEMNDPDQVEKCRCSTPPSWEGPPMDKEPRRTYEPYIFRGREDLTHSAFVASETIEFLKRGHSEPFFCIAGFYAPHCPVNPPERFVQMYNESEMPLPAMNEEERKKHGFSDAEWQKVRAYYYALISHVDDQVGRIMKCLEETGQMENTLLIFTSDHGDHLGDHGIVGKGDPGYDSCIHVPLILSAPGVGTTGRMEKALVEAVDIAPTILDFCGVQTPPFMQGRSMRPLLLEEETEPRRSIYMESKNPFRSSWKTVRTDAFKYCTSGDGQELLFDLETDPHELADVAADKTYKTALNNMRRELIRRWFDVEKQYPLRTGDY